jgi:hypothetical protein
MYPAENILPHPAMPIHKPSISNPSNSLIDLLELDLAAEN